MKRYGLFFFLAFSYTMVYFHRNSLAVLALSLEEEFLLGASSLGLLGAAFLYPYSLMQIPAGLLSDRVHPIKVIKLSLALMVLGTLLFASGWSFGLLFSGRLLLGFGTALFFVPAVKVLSFYYSPTILATLSGALITFGSLGAIMATSPLAWSTSKWDWRYSMLAIAFLGGLFFIGSFFVKGGYPQKVKENQAKSVKNNLFSLFSNIPIHIIALWHLAFCATKITFHGLWAGPFLRETYNYSQVLIGLLLLIIVIGTMLGSPLAGYLADKYGSKTSLLLGSWLYTFWWVFMAVYPFELPFWFVIISFLFMGITSGFFVVIFAWSRKFVEDNAWGFTMGYINSTGFLGPAVMMQISGIILDGLKNPDASMPYMAGYRLNFVLFAVVMVVCSMLLMLVANKEQRTI